MYKAERGGLILNKYCAGFKALSFILSYFELNLSWLLQSKVKYKHNLVRANFCIEAPLKEEVGWNYYPLFGLMRQNRAWCYLDGWKAG